MAENARAERQLMRQRGAGDRDIATADFDFNFEAGSREDRQLMRQRGAGTRQVDTVDFGFHFATPSTIRSRTSRIASKSPDTASRQHGHIRRTPEPVSGTTDMQPPTSTRSVRFQEPINHSESVPSEQPPRKRRRLSEISNMTRASSVVPVPVDQPINGEETPYRETGPVQLPDYVPPSPLFFPNPKSKTLTAVDKENDSSLLSNASRSSTKKRKRKSIGQQSLRRKRRTMSLQPLPTPPETQEGDARNSETIADIDSHAVSNHLNRQSRRWSVASQEPDSRIFIQSSETPSHLTPSEPPQSLEDLPGPSEDGASTKVPAEFSMPEVPMHSIEHDVLEAETEDSDSEADELSLEFTESGLIAQTRGSSQSASAMPRSESSNEHYPSDPEETAAQTIGTSPRYRTDVAHLSHVNNDEESDEDYAPAATITKQKRPRQRQVGPQHSNSRRRSVPTNEQGRRRKPGIPVLIHRITNVDRLPTIREDVPEDDRNSETDEHVASAPSTFTTRKSPNAVDVLRQACHEAIDARIEELQETDMSSTEFKNCTIALQTFKTALHTQLFQISQSLDHRLNLEARVRKSRQQKAELQSKWLQLRQQRDRLDLKKDAVRRKHWENEIVDRKQFQTSQAAFALENALARHEGDGEVDAISGLELRLRIIAKDVSSQAGGGILQNLKNFNALLERLASVS